MTKRNKFYQIGFIVSTIVCIGLMLAMGIIAIQKQMKLNLAVKMNPSIVCEIYASMNGENGTYNKIFSNVEGSTSIGTNWSISGNTLSYNTSSTDMGKEIYLKVTNKTTGTRVMVEYNNEVKDVIEVNGTSTTPFSVSIPGNGKVQMLFSQVFKVTTTLTHASITATTNLYEIGGTYYAKTGTTPTMTLTSDTHYTNPPSSVEVTGATKGYTNGVLTLSNITGDVTVTASASAATYTVSSNLSGISSNTIANKATYNTNYTFTLTVASTSWTIGTVTYTVGGGSAQTLTGTTTDNLTYTYTIPGNEITGAIVINATATSSYSIYATINGEDVLIGEYYQKSIEQPITINYPSTFTGIGGLMSSVAGVSEVTATQITIAANTTGPITIVPKGYTIGTYTNDSTDVAYNAAYSVENLKATEIYYTPYAGYKYIQFNGASSYLDVDNDGTTTRHLRWIIIGSATGDKTTYGEGGDENPYTLDSSGNETTTKELLDNECLMLSEQVIAAKAFDASKTSAQWNAGTSNIRIWLNGDFLTSTGLNNYKGGKIQPKNLYTTFATNKNETSKTATYTSSNDYMFLLAYHYNAKESPKYASYYLQDYMMQRYLGDVGSSNGKIHTFSGASDSYWWLRSGDDSNAYNAYFVNGSSNVFCTGVNYSYLGVRPSFVFNLA